MADPTATTGIADKERANLKKTGWFARSRIEVASNDKDKVSRDPGKSSLEAWRIDGSPDS